MNWKVKVKMINNWKINFLDCEVFQIHNSSCFSFSSSQLHQSWLHYQMDHHLIYFVSKLTSKTQPRPKPRHEQNLSQTEPRQGLSPRYSQGVWQGMSKAWTRPIPSLRPTQQPKPRLVLNMISFPCRSITVKVLNLEVWKKLKQSTYSNYHHI